MSSVPLCYGACGVAWASCYAAAGLVAGTGTAGAGAPAAALACNAAEGTCMMACTGGAVAEGGALAGPLGAVIFGAGALAFWLLR